MKGKLVYRRKVPQDITDTKIETVQKKQAILYKGAILKSMGIKVTGTEPHSVVYHLSLISVINAGKTEGNAPDPQNERKEKNAEECQRNMFLKRPY
jgi:hypothetical protein